MGLQEFSDDAKRFDAAAQKLVGEHFLNGLADVLGTPADSVNGQTHGDPWPILDPAAYHGLASEVVTLIEPHTEADPVALLVSLLAEVGCMLGRGPHLVLDGGYHPLLIWPVMVGQTSKSRRGTAGRRIQTLLSGADPHLTRGQCKGNLSSREGLAFAVRDPQYREEPVKEKGKPTA